ncbi:hypothetical protein POPTR_005G174600v4 [Populus trichocarpa]|uniref:Uncharacterized protein n=2 Tax=Populus trichocarpa TaxID=3694 RepID=A0ACC0T0E4_POPTR|nr:fluoride export protein 1 [Populus trichocarpa]KAI9395022.1 hypothetical protein POPTR_005G174600v4 [Populus trichocarpa]KAI9395023.1 hypothetical protein POPTR_005G174600v4 [Populus trichocarpa]
MVRGTNESEPNLSESFRQTSNVGSSVRRRSLSLSRSRSFQVDDDIESENVSEAGDIGDRALHSKRHNEIGSISLSIDSELENGTVFPLSNDNFLRSHGLWAHDSTALNTRSPVLPSAEEIVSPISTDAVVCSREKQEDKEKAFVLPPALEYISCLLYLAVFGILGVLTRYLLQKLFGPGVAGVTSDNYPLYLDLPSNMVGSFLMGWWGVVFKEDISKVSGHLTIGLTTGYLGSLTTFSGWNQKMLDLSVNGHWVFSFVGFLIGLFLAAYSIKFGVGTAKCFKSLFQRSNRSADLASWRVDTPNHHFAVMVVLVVMLGLLWALSGALLKEEYNHDSSGAQLWLGCIVAPLGVWIRWFLARLNGRGLGKAGSLKWIPFGTLIANVSAACIMAALSTVKKAVHTKTCDTISTGIQFGFLGCLSTVSTFIAEYNAMEESQKSWRAYVYALVTIVVSFGLGTLIYSVPVWSRGYK